ncbi:hypothetical protein CANINC_004219 [Pichia inconspicua]|uniref:Uncharacterized protein n=1 Tax=Pichia inconspicua TaxID=52247 RepID=A0A4V4NFB3_9ASCO|nr:hypothetical protein CANINC_004219 [[Candida] inconspicua]
MRKPYSFTDCIGDLEHVFLSLVNDINYSGKNNQLTNKNVKDKQLLKQKVHDGDNSLTYSLVSFTTQVLKICSPESISELLPQLLLELKNPKYPQTCIIESAKSDKKEDNSCFDVLQRLAPLTTFYKTDDTFNNIQKVKLTKNFIEDYKNLQFLSGCSNKLFISSSTKSKAERNKAGRNKTGKDKTHKLLPTTSATTVPNVKTTTVSKTLFEVIKTPSVSVKYLTITQLSQATKAAIGRYNKADTILKVKGNVEKTTTITDLLINLSVSTILLEPKTVTITYNGNLNKGREAINEEVTPQVFNFLSRLSAIPLTINSNATATNPRPIRSRLCDRITLFGLQCPFRSTATMSTVDKTTVDKTTVDKATEYVNININVNENKGNIKLLRQSVSQNPNKVTKVVTQKTTIKTIIASTKVKQIKTLTTITNTQLTTKTKYKIITQTQTKDIHDCENGMIEHEVDDNGLTEDDYFEDDSKDHFKESNEILESSTDYETNESGESDGSGDILIIQLAAKNTNYSIPSDLIKANDSKPIESTNFNNDSFTQFADELGFENGSRLKTCSEIFSLITLFLVFSIL